MHMSLPAGVNGSHPRRAYLACAQGLMIVAATIIAGFTGTETEAKTPGSTYCFYKKCHRVKSLTETRALVGEDVTLAASHYNDCRFDRYNPCGLTSSGEKFHPDRADNAASPIYPDGTILLVWNEVTEDAAVIRINNAGPYWGNRKLDVSIATAEQLGFRKRGVATLATRILQAPDKRDATYVRHRRYRPVPGYIGKHASIDEAERAAVAAIAVTAIAASMLAPSSGAVAMATQAETDEEASDRITRARQAEPLRAVLHQIEDLPVSPVAIPPPPLRALTDAWIEYVEPASVRPDAQKEMTSETRHASAVTEPSVAPAALGSRNARSLRAAMRLRGRQIAAHTRSSTTPVIATKEVGAARPDSWQTLLFDHLKIEASFVSRGRLSHWDGDRHAPTPWRPHNRFAMGVPKITRLANLT